MLLSLAILVDRIIAVEEPVVGVERRIAMIPVNSAVVVVTPPGSEVIARIGAVKLLAGETVSVEALDANYLRRSDAEIFFKGNR